jgi:hypothetical protein
LTCEEVVTVISQSHSEALSDASRTARQSMLGKGNFPWLLLAALSRHFGAFNDVPCSNQTPVRLAQLPDDDVHRVMQSVGEIAVKVTRWSEQCLVPVGHAAK